MNLLFSGQFETDKHILEYFPDKRNGVAIDVGAVDGRYMSNTLYFEENLDWTVLCIEPNPTYYTSLTTNRKHTLNVAISSRNRKDVDFHIYTMSDGNQSSISSLSTDQKLIDYHLDEYNIKFEESIIKVQVQTLNECLKKFTHRPIDFVSIDTEGTENSVLRGFDIDLYQPKLFVIENNWEENTQGVTEYLSYFGYKFDKRIGVNDFFIRE